MVCSARPPLALKPGHSSTVQASGTSGRTILAVTVDNWLIDEFAALGTDLEDCEPDPPEGDGL